MSFAVSAALQAAVYGALTDDAAVVAAVGGAIYDQAPQGEIPATYLSIGEEAVKDASDQTGRGAWHDFVVTVVTEAPGFAEAKAAAATVCDALIDADLTLTRGTLVSLNFLGARAQRTRADARRRIDLRFRARTEDNAI